ncbi:MAG: exo-alpha-sialidase [Pirellulales bacterium]|nr:exo-alpha-sialidase [Pirellulales bacterium]
MNAQRIQVLIAAILLFGVSDIGASERRIRPTVPLNQPRAEIISEYVICKQPGRYIGWPSSALAQNGDVLIAFSGDRDWHVCPWGKIFIVRKPTGKNHFGEPELVVNTPLDDRDAGLVVLKDGTVLLSFSTSIAFADPKIERYKPYRKHAAKLSKDIRKRWLGSWLCKSTDNGKTWGPYISAPAHAPHGPTVLSDSRLLYVRPSVFESRDQGDTWKKIARIKRDPQTWNSRYAFLSEQHAVEVKANHIIALSRYREKKGDDICLRQMESFDGGLSWSSPQPTDMPGYPAHLLRLENGWLLASYGRRIAPMGERACISIDEGKTWDVQNEIILSNAVLQNPGHLGYPSSIQLSDGTIWTIYYQIERPEDGEYPSLMATHWKLKDE